MDFDEWFRKRFSRGFFFPDIDEMIKDMEREFERSFKEIQSKIPQNYVRERKLPDGSITKEWGPFIYGYSMTLGPDGKPVIREFGNIRPGLPGPTPFEFKGAREPFFDVLDEAETVKVVVELPGVEKQDINLEATDKSLTVSVDTERKKYHKEIELPAEVDPSSAKSSFKNGVLEVTLRKLSPRKKAHRIKVE
ncbi:MAG: archaeal heat shock protein Hsp20 [Nitrososphaerota archaeon]